MNYTSIYVIIVMSRYLYDCDEDRPVVVHGFAVMSLPSGVAQVGMRAGSILYSHAAATA